MKSVRVFLWTSFAVGAVLSMIAQVHSEDESSAMPVIMVWRRQSFDSYTTLDHQNNSTEVTNCDDDNATYLVKEAQCIDNYHLLNESSFVATPTGELGTPQLHLNIDMAGNSTTAQTTNANSEIVNAVVAFKSKGEQVNSSFCRISSLEVYRGREQAIEISHQGLLLSENGTIKIQIDQLAYNTEDYEGELYRMNLSCFGGGLPESGCLFFKVLGTTDIQDGKFNCSVAGTLPTHSSPCSSIFNNTRPPPTIESDTQEPTTSPPTSGFSQTMTDSNTIAPNTLEIGSPLFYGIVGAGAAVIIMTLFCLICICVMLGCTRECKCGRKIGAANKGQPAPYEEVEIQDMKMQGYNPSFYTDSISPYNTTEQDLENKYAEIGAMYQEISPRVHNPKSPAWERTSSAVTNTGSEPPQHQYSTLEQVGGQAMRNNLTNSVTNINSEQYAQLVRD